MTVRPLRALMLGSFVLPLAFATASLAQDHSAPPSGGAPAAVDDRHHGWRDPAARAEAMAKHLEREAARLRDVLQLRPEQEGALHAFLESMKPPADAMEPMKKDHEEDAHLTTPQRLDRMLARLEEHRTHLLAHAEAVKRFYAQLSPSQQKAFDAIGPMMMHGRGMGGHPGGPMGGPPEDGPMAGPPPAA